MKILSPVALLLTLCSLLLCANPTTAQTAASAQPRQPDPLYVTVARLDAELFHAYNTCDLKTLAAMVSDDLEFYHDKTGLAVGKEPFLTSIKNYICGKVQRDLVKDSLEVYPLNTYGAVEIGTHRFHHPGQTNDDPGEAKFVMLWQQKDGLWKLTRVISYDHAAMAK